MCIKGDTALYNNTTPAVALYIARGNHVPHHNIEREKKYRQILPEMYVSL